MVLMESGIESMIATIPAIKRTANIITRISGPDLPLFLIRKTEGASGLAAGTADYGPEADILVFVWH